MWNQCGVLFMTVEKEETFWKLYACSPDLKMFLLLEEHIRGGAYIIDQESYFNFITVKNKVFEKSKASGG